MEEGVPQFAQQVIDIAARAAMPLRLFFRRSDSADISRAAAMNERSWNRCDHNGFMERILRHCIRLARAKLAPNAQEEISCVV
jgi:hypothetical protein